MSPPLGTWPTTQACALSGNRTGDPLVCSLHSIHWATPARVGVSFIKSINNIAKTVLIKCFHKSNTISLGKSLAVGYYQRIYKSEVCLQSIQPWNIKNRDIYWKRYKIQETLYIGKWCLSPLQSRHLETSHSSPNCHQLPCHIFLNLTDGLKSLPFQRWFYFWEKPEVTEWQIWAVGGLGD